MADQEKEIRGGDCSGASSSGEGCGSFELTLILASHAHINRETDHFDDLFVDDLFDECCCLA